MKTTVKLTLVILVLGMTVLILVYKRRKRKILYKGREYHLRCGWCYNERIYRL